MSDKETLRQQALQDSDIIGEKRRFGLFSQPPPIAIGDNGNFKNKKRISYHINSKKR